MSQWGVPDWRDASAYPLADELSPRKWRWEFTRRRPDYRRDWEQAPGSDEDGRRFLADRQLMVLKYQLNILLDPREAYSDFTLSSHQHSLNGSAPTSTRSSYGAMKQAQWLADHVEPNVVETVLQEERERAERSEAQGIVHYSFDLSQPLRAQLKKAAAQLEGMQEYRFGKKNSRKPRRDNWPLFLRAIDARDAGAKLVEMRDAFWPGYPDKSEQSARDIHTAACHLRDNFPT